MGVLDIFKKQVPTVQTILPQPAINEIISGRLPILNTNRILLKKGESCHYIDKSIYEKKSVKKKYIRHVHGGSFRGIMSDNVRHHYGAGITDVIDSVQYEMIRGILYITNKRVIFQGAREGFVMELNDVIAIQPYGNCVVIQCRKDNYKIFVPNGILVQTVLQLIN